MSLEVYLVRHGQTVFNKVGRVQGWSDSPLTTKGREIAKQLGRNMRHIQFEGVFASTSPRAYETAHLIIQNAEQDHLTVQQLANLREYCFGGFEGERTNYLHQLIAAHGGYASVEQWKQAYLCANHHMLAQAVAQMDTLRLAETEAQLLQRLQQGMAEVVQHSAGKQRVLVVSHGMAITAFLKSIDFAIMEYKSLPNASVSRLRYQAGQWHIDEIGNTSFLK